MFDQKLLKLFIHSHEIEAARWSGSINPSLFLDYLRRNGHDINIDVPSENNDRAGVYAFCNDRKHSAEQCFLVVMAWGGMRYPNLERAWNSRRTWIPIVDRLRSDHNGKSAYESFWRAKVPGMQTPYFTKLIYFCGSGKDPIYDQWTGKSMDLLLVDSPGFVGSNGQVGRASTGLNGHYQDAVQALGRPLTLAAVEVEFMLFAGKDHQWRNFVRDNWQCRQPDPARQR